MPQDRQAARKMTHLSTENIDALSPEEIRQIIHDLQVHQIELEMQNEELRAMHAELDSARERYFDLYDMAPVGYCTVEKELILESNLTAATLLGLDRNALFKQPLSRYILPDDQDIYYLHRKQLFETGEPQTCDLRMLKKGGSQFWAHLSATRVRDIGSALVCRIAITDITDVKRAEDALHVKQQQLEELNISLEDRIKNAVDELRRKDQMLIHQNRMAAMGEMIGNIAHQWRQPLNTLGLVIGNIKDAYDYNELDAQYLTQAVADSSRLIQKMSSTISDFANFFRPDKKMIAFSGLKQICDAISLVEASFKNNNITIHCDATEDVLLRGFPNEFSQVLLNLLVNAKDAIQSAKKPDGRVNVNLTTLGDKGCITVSDNGGGIPEEIHGRIFDPYFSTRNRGSGIGLYMSKMIIEDNMNGSITTRNIKDGAEFTIRIPLQGEAI